MTTTTATSGQPPELKTEGHVAVITLRRPAVANRLEYADLHTLRAQIHEVDALTHIRVLRIEAEGRHFCAGFNIGSFGAQDDGKDAEHVGDAFDALANALEAARPVTIAVVHGGVFGGATDLALACDFRLGSPACKMFVPAAKLGVLFYPGGLHRYVSRLGLNMAKKLLLTGATLDAQQMLASGFLDELHASDALAPAAQALGALLADMAPLALTGMKKHLNAIAAQRFDIDDYRIDLARAEASADLREGARAWLEKRAPVFTGN